MYARLQKTKDHPQTIRNDEHIMKIYYTKYTTAAKNAKHAHVYTSIYNLISDDVSLLKAVTRSTCTFQSVIKSPSATTVVVNIVK